MTGLEDLGEIARKYEDNVGFLSLLTDFDNNTNGARRYAEFYDFNIPTVHHQADGLLDLREMVRSGFVPTTVIIDGDGNALTEMIVGSKGLGFARYIEEALAAVRGQ